MIRSSSRARSEMWWCLHWVTVLVGVFAAGACDDGRPGKIEPGTWGGVGLILTVGSDHATAEFDCAAGRIDQPLVLTVAGTLRVPGSITLGHGGPVADNEEPDVHPAIYQGSFDDDELRISVRIPDLDTTTEAFRLRKGNPGLLRRCL